MPAPPPSPAPRHAVEVPPGLGRPPSSAPHQVLAATTAFVSLFAIVSLASSRGILYNALAAENAWTSADVMAPSLYFDLLATPIATVLAGVVSDRLGSRPLMIVGLLLAS